MRDLVALRTLSLRGRPFRLRVPRQVAWMTQPEGEELRPHFNAVSLVFETIPHVLVQFCHHFIREN